MTENKVTKSPSKNFSKPVTKYRPEYVEQVQIHMAKGYSFESFASKLDVDKSTLYLWCQAHPEFKEAKDRGVEKSRYKLERNLMRTAVTGKGNVIASLFMLKNRFPADWRDRKEIELQKNEAEANNNLTLDQQIEKIEAMREHLLRLKAEQQASEPLTIDTVASE